MVTAPECHLCEDARQSLAALSAEYPLAVQELTADSPAGRELLLGQGSGLFPLVMVDGAFFSAGRLPRRKLARLLSHAGHALVAGPR